MENQNRSFWKSHPLALALALPLFAAPLGACSGGSGGSGGPPDGGSGAPDGGGGGSTLTYQNFGKPFMDKYCVRCHAPNSATRFAPDLDTLARVKLSAARVDARAGRGVTMPPTASSLTATERANLTKWIAAGAP